uniref:Uncharacterized protein n=1 Tax=Caenorhabditis japonica TaxID=281687 RepID=A0A8R1DPN0_CAEJA
MPKKASWRQIRASNLYGTVKESPEVEIANLKSLLDDSEKRVEFVENQVSNLRQKLREREEEVEDLARKLNSKTEEFTCFRSISHAAIEEARRIEDGNKRPRGKFSIPGLHSKAIRPTDVEKKQERQDYLNSKLGFDVFSSRQEIDKIRKNHAPLDDYNINIETTTRCTRKGFEAKVPMAVVSAKNVKNLVERRFQSLQNNSRLQFEYDDEVALGFGGDKGADVTKLCIVFQNIASPNNPHGILLVGYYTGDDNYATE